MNNQDSALRAAWLSPMGYIALTMNINGIEKLAFCTEEEARILKEPQNRSFNPAISWLTAYFKGQRPDPAELKLSLAGSQFQLTVWNLLREVPYASITTYREMARYLAVDNSEKYARAVGNAIAKNPVWIILPCHRVIYSDGSLGGYAGGQEKKLKLLEHEGIPLSRIKRKNKIL